MVCCRFLSLSLEFVIMDEVRKILIKTVIHKFSLQTMFLIELFYDMSNQYDFVIEPVCKFTLALSNYHQIQHLPSDTIIRYTTYNTGLSLTKSRPKKATLNVQYYTQHSFSSKTFSCTYQLFMQVLFVLILRKNLCQSYVNAHQMNHSKYVQTAKYF